MSDRQQRKAEAKRAREAAEAEAARRAASRRRLQWTGLGAAAIAAIGAVAAIALSSGGGGTNAPANVAKLPPVQIADLKAAARAAGGRFTSYDWNYGTGNHVTTTVKYPTNPPLNGPHNPQWAGDGNYAGHPTPQTEQLVHALEHGRIEIQYRPGLPQAEIDQLVALYNEDPTHVLLFANTTDMNCDVAVTAWGHGLLCDRFSDKVFDAIRAFRSTYRDHGPEYVM